MGLNDVVRSRIPIFKCQINYTEFAFYAKKPNLGIGLYEITSDQAMWIFNWSINNLSQIYTRERNEKEALDWIFKVIEFQTEEFICYSLDCWGQLQGVATREGG